MPVRERELGALPSPVLPPSGRKVRRGHSVFVPLDFAAPGAPFPLRCWGKIRRNSKLQIPKSKETPSTKFQNEGEPGARLRFGTWELEFCRNVPLWIMPNPFSCCA